VFALTNWSLLLTPFGAHSAQDPCLNLGAPVWTNNQVQFTFLGEFGVTYFIESSSDLQNWAKVATNSDPAVMRLIMLDASAQPNFYRIGRAGLSKAAAGFTFKQGVSFKGDSITVDAYNSADTNLFPDGLWNSTDAFAGGNLAVLGGVLDIGNARIHGRLLLAPAASISIGPSGLVGDMPALWPAQSGIEGPEWVCNKFEAEMSDVVSPYNTGLTFAQGTGTNSFVLASGNYYANGDFSSSQNLQVSGNTTFYVTGSFSADTITIAPGGLLRLYVGQATGSSVSATFGNVNNTGNNYGFQFFGLPTCTALNMSGNNGFLGTVYAPEAVLTVSAAGNAAFEYQGACFANSLILSGPVNLHSDRNLIR